MAIYLVKAKPRKDLLENLYGDLNWGEILKMSPFEKALQFSLENARIDVDNHDYALWIEEDYCCPPLAMERESILDKYFFDIVVQRVKLENDGWNMIKYYPHLWNKN